MPHQPSNYRKITSVAEIAPFPNHDAGTVFTPNFDTSVLCPNPLDGRILFRHIEPTLSFLGEVFMNENTRSLELGMQVYSKRTHAYYNRRISQ